MSPVTLLIIGFLVYAIGFYDVVDEFTAAVGGKSAASSGYPDISFPRFIMGAAVAAAPMMLDIDEDTKKQYAFLILLSFAIYNYRGLQQASAEAQALLNTVK